MSRYLVRGADCDDFAANYFAATKGIKSSSILFEENAITEMIHQGALDETLNQSFSRRLRSDTFMEVLVYKNVNDPGIVTPSASFFTKCLKRGRQRAQRKATSDERDFFHH